jgi:2-isopropylmalate synthase
MSDQMRSAQGSAKGDGATADWVRIFDTTLRDGEQSPGCTMNVDEKILVAQQLEALNVDVIEAGFAAASGGDFEAVRRVAQTVTTPVVLSLSRPREADIERALAGVDKAKRPGIHIFIATSELHMKHKLGMSAQEVVDAAVWAVERAKRHVDYIEFSAEDASRSDIEFLCKIFGEVIAAGAIVCNVPDTTGYGVPHQIRAMFRRCARRHRAATASCGARTTTTISAWRSRTRWPRSKAARGKSSARSTASASARATRRWKKS